MYYINSKQIGNCLIANDPHSKQKLEMNIKAINHFNDTRKKGKYRFRSIKLINYDYTNKWMAGKKLKKEEKREEREECWAWVKKEARTRRVRREVATKGVEWLHAVDSEYGCVNHCRLSVTLSSCVDGRFTINYFYPFLIVHSLPQKMSVQTYLMVFYGKVVHFRKNLLKANLPYHFRLIIFTNHKHLDTHASFDKSKRQFFN